MILGRLNVQSAQLSAYSMTDYWFTPAAAANPAVTTGGSVLAGGGSAKLALLALIAFE
jgi:hypothetical protein